MRDEFDGIQDVKFTKGMLDLAKHIVETKAGTSNLPNSRITMRQPCKNCWRNQPIASAKKPRLATFTNLMDALRASIKAAERAPTEKPVKAVKGLSQPNRQGDSDATVFC